MSLFWATRLSCLCAGKPFLFAWNTERGSRLKTIITGARLLDPLNGVDMYADVLIEGRRITAIGHNLPSDGAEVIVAEGKVLVPGLVDIHVHLREPGREHKETIMTGGKAAAAGGFTAVCAMPNTLPPIDSVDTAQLVLEKAKASPVHCYPIGAITLGQKGQTLTDATALLAAGCIALSDDGEPVDNSKLLYEVLLQSKKHGQPVITHCEDKALAGKGAMHEGYRSTVLGIPGIPSAAEDAMVARDIALAGATGGKLHIAHVSTAGSMLLIRQAKDSGVNVTCEVTPHHLVLTHDVVRADDANTKMNPPLRTREDVEALRQALKDGYIDCIATDHAPHHASEKAAHYEQAPFGIVGLETALPLLITELVLEGVVDLPTLVSLMTARPAHIVNIPHGQIVRHGLADLTLIDLSLTKEVNPESFYSLGRNTPFAGRALTGWPVLTMVNGKIVMKDGVVFE